MENVAIKRAAMIARFKKSYILLNESSISLWIEKLKFDSGVTDFSQLMVNNRKILDRILEASYDIKGNLESSKNDEWLQELSAKIDHLIEFILKRDEV